MKEEKPIYKELHNPADFKKELLSQSDISFCEVCDTEAIQMDEEGNNFLEIAPLEQIKSLHKNDFSKSTRRKFYTAVLVTSGTTEETIGYTRYTFGKGTLYFIPENQLHTIHDWSEDIRGYHCIFDADYFLLCLKNQVKLNKYPFFQSDKQPFIKLSVTESEMIENLFRKMSSEYCNKATINDDLLVRLYLNVFLIETEKIYQKQNKVREARLSRKELLVTRFKNMVSENHIRNKQVADYARLLSVNPHYLNDVVKEITGNSASSFIHNQLVAEAKTYLIQTDETISRISEILDFTDQAYFCRFFKKHTGKTPTEYRKDHHH